MFDPFKLNGLEVLEIDSQLNDYAEVIKHRWSEFLRVLYEINTNSQGIEQFSDYTNYGFYIEAGNTIQNISSMDWNQVQSASSPPNLVYREWIGNGKYVAIVGDFNNWDNTKHYSNHQDMGVHTISIPFTGTKGRWECPIKENQKYKIFINTHDGQDLYRHPQHCLYAILNKEISQLEPQWHIMEKFQFKQPKPQHDVLRIYETHIGMSSEEEKINTYRDFADNILPRIANKGYNAVQIMALQEHAYYGSFGYQVTSFFAPSSRFGPPEDFRYLVEKAHSLKIQVYLDLVHSHASKNVTDGIANWDGTKFLFHEEDHPLWDSKVFDYTHPETLRFLLQNLNFWLTEFNIDGFRFDGCMSMMYWHRSAGEGYTGRYGEYFDDNSRVDIGALTYLRLAHYLFLVKDQKNNQKTISIAEDVSGYPTLATPLQQGGIGFDYRFQMAVPDLWVKFMKSGFDLGLNDESNLDMGKIRHALCNRRWQEKHIVYAECHDQALVGDKVLLMWLLNEKIYSDMSAIQGPEDRTDRGIRLHKVIRLLTIGMGGEGYLAFMGNEFGHPEWIDFPRTGNGESFKHCRRQWSLEDSSHTKFHWLSLFDKDLMNLNKQFPWQLSREFVNVTDNEAKTLVWDRANLVFIISMHPFNGDYEAIIPIRQPGAYKVVLTSNGKQYGGDGQGTQKDNLFRTIPESQCDNTCRDKLNGCGQFIKVWIKKQCGYVLEKIE
ncbi:1,4-alpha-glucan branching enzyme [Spironucleus salmonicida]|uniref:1,4-alpha-glucan branching enzyme n=1 Tax=Spironucleus salmonicida TaxID=348837 RepID=V6LK50_9EUKA|nr:1,4-alpha-glucan branching enzyme [Spironucleus salmonicida]|eukprot:EST44927.1 1,4-alpha-glucan branching enzyme [Spironucleus salmonicida]